MFPDRRKRRRFSFIVALLSTAGITDIRLESERRRTTFAIPEFYVFPQ
jgi:hypothetical protein